MTAEGASSRDGRRAKRPWQAVQRLSSRTSLRVKLITALLALVIFALVAMGLAGISLLRGQLIGPIDSSLLQEAYGTDLLHCAQDNVAGFNNVCAVSLDVSWIGDNGQVIPVPTAESTSMGGYPPTGGIPSPPNLTPAITTWLVDNTRHAITVPAESGSGRWRVMSFPVPDGSGTVVLAENATSAYNTLQQLTGVDLIVSAVIVVVLAIVGFAVVQANLRPLVDIEETAEEIAAGHLNRRVPERDPRTEIGRLGRSLNMMLSQIESAFHAREESEAAAHHSEERMRRFIADASHELRTPLTAIRGFAEYYRQRGGLVPHWDRDRDADTVDGGTLGGRTLGGGLTPDDLDRIMKRVEKEAARMGVLVEDLLLLARLDQQRPLAQQPIDLLSLAADAVHDARLIAPARTITLQVQPGAAFLITGDETRLRQVIGNLMSNALAYSPDGTPIELSIGSGILDPRVNDSPPAVILDVTDHGPGMTAEQAHRVFERFYRADQARTRTADGGSGLGLAIVSALVTAHGGVASVRTAPGQGATFRIALPLAPEAQGEAAPDDDPDHFDLTDQLPVADETGDASVTYGTEIVDATAEAETGVDADQEARQRC